MYTLNCKGRLLSMEKPLIMGIINVNDDSFYAESRKSNLQSVLSTAESMLEAGAAILDIGGQSTRPGSVTQSADQEVSRVVPAVQAIIKRFPEAIISVDTYYSQVALAAVDAGALMINDISAGLLDKEMLSTVGALKVPFVAMHMRGNPENMQSFCEYKDLMTDITDYFIERLAACRAAGVTDVVIDPGFGFSKTREQNYTLLAGLEQLRILQAPVLAGLSRKSMIYQALEVTAEQALNGSTVLQTYALLHGAHILRVHDVKEAAEAIELLSLLQKV